MNTALNKIRIIVFISLLSLLTLCFLKESNKEQNRYGLLIKNTGPCLLHLKNTAPQQIDLIAIGGSRILTALMPDEVEKYYKENFSNDITVYNFAKNWYGQDFEYQILKDIYEQGIEVKTVLLYLAPQRRKIFHPLEYSFLETKTITDAWTKTAKNNFLTHSSHTLWALTARIRDIIFSAKTEHIAEFETFKHEINNTCYPTDYDEDPTKLKKAVARYNKKGVITGNLELEKNSYADYFYKKTIAIAKKNNSKIMLVYVPKMNAKLLSKSTISNIENMYGVPVIQPPIDIRQKLNNQGAGYRDGSHIDKAGRKVFTPWLIQKIYKKTPIEK